jgi:hypothetical protein
VLKETLPHISLDILSEQLASEREIYRAANCDLVLRKNRKHKSVYLLPAACVLPPEIKHDLRENCLVICSIK